MRLPATRMTKDVEKKWRRGEEKGEELIKIVAVELGEHICTMGRP